MAAIAAERDLLFGLLALQNGLIDQGQLVAAFQAWTRDKARALADHLVGRGDLDADDRSAVEALVARHLKKHGGDVERSLAAIPAGHSTRESLARIDDPDVGGPLARLGSASTQHGDDADRTASYAVGEATSEGQRFRILRPHARGGLGAVFVALDVELHREVALKQILDAHADDPASRQRFLVEAEVTGGLEHPGIVPVYGLGTYGEGRPFYAMRFIRGDSLKGAIERFHADASLQADPGGRSLELRKLLRRFIDVCNAIDYAHARGVLHRDIKPGNIIVGKHGETLVVDWGLAKARGRADAGESSDERPLVPSSASGSAETLPGSALGTPAYMSPEQARGDLEAMGPRSDVYSLGATLYCVLTGRPPVADDDLGAVLQAVQAGAFQPPRQLDATIDPALEAVCLKAMALRPEDRYATPRALAEDIERWMADEPVTARRETRSERLSRWVRRHREWARAAVAALVLVTAVSLIAAFAIDLARGAERAARDRATRALSAETSALAAERSAKAEALANFQTARQAVQDYLTTVSESVLLKQQDRADLRALRKQLLDGALAYYQGFIARHGDDSRLLAESADAYARVGAITSEIGSKEDALRSYERAREIRQKLAGAGPSTAQLQSDIAKDNLAIGRLELETGRTDRALVSLERACEIGQRLVEDHALESGFQFDLAGSHGNLGVLFYETGRIDLAMRSFERSLEILQRLIALEPAVTRFQKGLADTYHNVGVLHDQSGRAPEGLQLYEKALQIRRKLAEANPSVTEFRRDLANTHLNMGMLERMTGSNDEALRSYERALEILRILADANPSVTEFQSDLARIHNSTGLLHRATRRREEALRSFERAREIQRKLADAYPSVTLYRSNLAATLGNIGLLHHDADNISEALPAYERALEIQRKLADAKPPIAQFRIDLAWILKNIALVQRQAGRVADAHRSFEEAIAIWDEIRSPSGVVLYLKASALAQVSDLDGPGSTGRATADLAMLTLHKAVAAGYHDMFSFSGDITLDPLRSRSDFQLLMMDLAFPADPFAWRDGAEHRGH
jgi:serine/threonine-protein kinase